jgi:hypothetical protein
MLLHRGAMLFMAFLLSGCTYGFIYTDTAVPLVLNMKETPNPSNAVSVSLGQLKLEEPFTPVGLRIEINSNAIGEAAKKHGIQEIYYADLRTISFLGGIYQMKSVYVTGLPKPDKNSTALKLAGETTIKPTIEGIADND